MVPCIGLDGGAPCLVTHPEDSPKQDLLHKNDNRDHDQREGRWHVVGRDDLTDRGDRDAHGRPKEHE